MYKKVLLVVLVSLLCFGCQKKAENETAVSVGFADNSTFHTDAHKKYLNDKIDFSHYAEIENSVKDNSYLVASDYCKFYPKELLIPKGGDTAILNPDFKGEGIPVPLGTILKAAGSWHPIENKNKISMGYDEWFDAFNFEDEYNYFYEVEYNGQIGYVFGADLMFPAMDKIAYYSELYMKDGKLDYFSPLEGLKHIPENIKEALPQNRVVIQDTEPITWLQVDDLIDSYNSLDFDTPIFITTDLAAHSQHLIFDRLLQYTEETYFLPRTQSICTDFITALKNRTDVSDDIKNKAIAYFQVPELIMRTAPKATIVTEDWVSMKKYIAPDNIPAIVQEYPADVQAEFRQIMAASGEETAVFGTREDFTQYKPRGHYTKNGALEAYFRASMWFGRIHFAFEEKDPESVFMPKIALFIVDTVNKNPELYKKWTELFDPITTLIGESDDLGFNEVLPLWKKQKVDNYLSWTNNKSNIISFIRKCNKQLTPPAISSNTVLLGFDKGGKPILLNAPPMGWRFLGQRFTLDSHFFAQVKEARESLFVYGLDVMRILGSKAAESIFSESEYKEADGQDLKKIHDTLRRKANELDEAYWTKTYYNTTLATIRAQTTFGQGAGFYFTECPMWDMKSLISSHATWAELRHDTILYVKQEYGEKGGDGDWWELTDRTKPLPKPTNYIEPNLSFWNLSLKSAAQLIDIYKSYNLLDSETARILSSLTDMYERIYSICCKEVADEAISDDDNWWIRSIPDLLADFVMIHQNQGEMQEQKDLQMACIADVYTHMDTKKCLEVGVGVPYKVYIPLNDCNGKRISVGYIPSYYEFYHPMENRLNDDQWKEPIYSGADMSKYRPSWSESCILPIR